MKKMNYFGWIFIIVLFCHCSTPAKKCTIREWKVMDLYRNDFPSFVDTLCGDQISLVNKVQVDRSFLDSVFEHLHANRSFSMDTAGAYNVDTSTIVKADGGDHEVAKVTYLSRGQNADQGFFLYVVRHKGVYIQQESHDKKLYLLMSVRDTEGRLENTGTLAENMIRDTILFPLPPRMP